MFERRTLNRHAARLLLLTEYPVDRAPHAEWTLWVLAKAGWKVECWAVSASRSLVRAFLGGAWPTTDLYRSGASPLLRELGIWRALLAARWGRYDVVVVDSMSLAYRAAFVFALPWRRQHVVYQARDFVDPRQWRVRSLLEGILLRRVDLHINHEYHRAYIYRTVHRACCPVVLLPPNLPASWPVPQACERLRRELAGEAGEEAFLLRLHGGLSELRRTTQLLTAMTMLPRRFRLVMGAGPTRQAAELERLLGRLGLVERVVRLPWLDFCEMLEYTVCCDAGVLLYANNDLGNFFQCPGRLTEYLACGVPLLASNFTGLSNLVSRYRVGVPVDGDDPKSIARGIVELERLRRSGEYSSTNIRKRFEEHFALEHWAPMVAEAFRQLVERDHGDPSFCLRDGWLLVRAEHGEPWVGAHATTDWSRWVEGNARRSDP